MADSKVSELTSATSAGGSDVLYLVQSNTSKKITVANFLGNAGNVTLTGNINIGGTPQSLGAPGIISLTLRKDIIFTQIYQFIHRGYISSN